MENITVIAAIRISRMVAGKVPVLIRIIVGRKVAKTFNTGIKISPGNWDAAGRSVMKKEPNSQLYNMKIKKEISRLEAEFTSRSLLGVPLTKKRVQQIAEGKEPGKDFYQFCNEWLPQKYTNPETLRTYRSEITKLQKYVKELSFGDIGYKFLTGYKKHMQMKLGNSSNTIWKSFKFMNTMIIDAMKMGGIIDHNPFKDFGRGSYANPDKLGLEIEHCNLIEPLCTREDVPVIIRKVAIRFLLMCYSGLRFEDALKFRPEAHVIDGERIFMKTQKKGVTLNMKFYDRLERIINLLRGDTFVVTNKEFNKWLKVMANLAGIGHMKVTCHVGRHTFGGILAEMEIPEEQAQKLLAHKDIRSTRVYYHVKNKSLDKAVDKLNNI